MGYPTTIQLIRRKRSQQWYVNFPAAVANALDCAKGETVEWTLLDRRRLLLVRRHAPKAPSIAKRLRKPARPIPPRQTHE